MDFFSLSLISILQWFEKLVYFSPENTRFKKQLNRDRATRGYPTESKNLKTNSPIEFV